MQILEYKLTINPSKRYRRMGFKLSFKTLSRHGWLLKGKAPPKLGRKLLQMQNGHILGWGAVRTPQSGHLVSFLHTHSHKHTKTPPNQIF